MSTEAKKCWSRMGNAFLPPKSNSCAQMTVQIKAIPGHAAHKGCSGDGRRHLGIVVHNLRLGRASCNGASLCDSVKRDKAVRHTSRHSRPALQASPHAASRVGPDVKEQHSHRSPAMLNTCPNALGFPSTSTNAEARSFTWPNCVTCSPEFGTGIGRPALMRWKNLHVNTKALTALI